MARKRLGAAADYHVEQWRRTLTVIYLHIWWRTICVTLLRSWSYVELSHRYCGSLFGNVTAAVQTCFRYMLLSLLRLLLSICQVGHPSHSTPNSSSCGWIPRYSQARIDVQSLSLVLGLLPGWCARWISTGRWPGGILIGCPKQLSGLLLMPSNISSPPNVQTPHPIIEAEPSQPLKRTHFSILILSVTNQISWPYVMVGT